MIGLALQYLGFEPLVDFVLVDSGSGPTIERWLATQPQPTQQEIDAAVLPATKQQRIDAINAECRSRLIARYGSAEEQVSRSLAIYGEQEAWDMRVGISATVDASNVASNAVIAAATIEDVEAVAVTWPTI